MNNFVTLKGIVDENFQDYKKASMFLAFPRCDFKCFRELNLPNLVVKKEKLNLTRENGLI